MTFPVRRGLNLSHWLSQNRNLHHDRDTDVTRDDFARVAGWGFDHVRLPVDEVQLYDEAGRRSPDTFGYLGQALGWAADTGLSRRSRPTTSPGAGGTTRAASACTTATRVPRTRR